MFATWPDILRVFVLPAFAYVAIADVRTRRVPSLVWIPLVLLGAVALLWEAWTIRGTFGWQLWAIRVGFSLGVVAPLGYLFWRFGVFGLADAKALITIAVVFPTYPTFVVFERTLPAIHSEVGIFSLTILVNAVLVGLVYPLALALRNLRRRRIRWAMFVGLAVPWRAVERRHGRLLEGVDGFARQGLDLDALRMYLRWRDTSLAALREDPDRYRDPASLPTQPGDPGDGRVRTDGGSIAEDDDPWGARAFVEATGGPYGTRVDELRAALELLVEREHVWISPGIPFLLLLAIGIAVALTLGSLMSLISGPLAV